MINTFDDSEYKPKKFKIYSSFMEHSPSAMFTAKDIKEINYVSKHFDLSPVINGFTNEIEFHLTYKNPPANMMLAQLKEESEADDEE